MQQRHNWVRSSMIARETTGVKRHGADFSRSYRWAKGHLVSASFHDFWKSRMEQKRPLWNIRKRQYEFRKRIENTIRIPLIILLESWSHSGRQRAWNFAKSELRLTQTPFGEVHNRSKPYPHFAALKTPARVNNIDLHLRCCIAKFEQFARSLGSFSDSLFVFTYGPYRTTT